MRFVTALLFLLALSTLLTAAISTHFEIDGLRIERQLSVQPIGAIDPSVGVARTRYASTVTLILTNPGPSDRENVVLAEDLSYLPPYVQLSFSEKPQSESWT